MAAIGVIFFVLFFLVVFGASIAGMVYWVIALVEIARIPDQQFRAAGSDKTTWVLVVGLTQIVGALVWHFTVRANVVAAAGRIPAPPPGWYPSPDNGVFRWWDGGRWTEASHVPPPPSSPPVG
jgi:hypothetical protein